MKRTFSVLLAAMMSMSMAAMAFAENAKTNSIALSADASSKVSLSGGLLTPGEKYRFPVSISLEGGEMQPLTAEILENYSFKLSNSGEGETLSDFNLSKSGDNYYIVAEVKAGWPSEKTEEEYSIKLVNKNDRKDFVTYTTSFETGYEVVSDEYVDSLQKEDDIKVENKTPVFDAEQLERLAKRNGYKKVAFTDGDWSFSVSINDMKAINLVHNQNAIKEIVEKYEDNSFEFLTFPAGTKFKTNGTMELDVSAYSDDFGGKFFVYRYLDGKLTGIAAKYNSEEETLSFTTDTLGRFVITDQEITNAVVVPSTGSNNSNNSNNGSNNSTGGSVQNPSTGAKA